MAKYVDYRKKICCVSLTAKDLPVLQSIDIYIEKMKNFFVVVYSKDFELLCSSVANTFYGVYSEDYC